MEPMNRTSRVLAVDSPGLENKFRMPLAFPEQDLLNAARTFLANATPLETEFIREEMPSDFLEQLSTAIDDFKSAINDANRTKDSKVSAHEAQDDDLSDAVGLLRKLDVVVRNKFAHDREMLAEWTSASHIERHSTSKHPDNPPPPRHSTPPSSDPLSGLLVGELKIGVKEGSVRQRCVRADPPFRRSSVNNVRLMTYRY